MGKRFFSTNNRRWYTTERSPRYEPWSERDFLYYAIQALPGIGSAELEELWPFATSMRSRLKEISDAGYIRSELVSDLFAASVITDDETKKGNPQC